MEINKPVEGPLGRAQDDSRVDLDTTDAFEAILDSAQ
jgi:hypothetical protein